MKNSMDHKYIKNSLIEAKNIFNDNYPDLVMMHMLIVNNDMSKKLLSNSEDINDRLFIFRGKFYLHS